MTRLAHISDVHVSAVPLGWRVGDTFNKRLTSWLNVRFRRRSRFIHADAILAAFRADIATRRIDHVVFSGDATSLGFASELTRAAAALGVGQFPGLAVPGNHDYLTRSAACSGDFERIFAPWQVGQRIGQHPYPFAQRVGGVWLVGVNSARGNRLFWDASGEVGDDQRRRLAELLSKLDPGPRILVTHYPVRLADGRRENIMHGLVDVDSIVETATAGGVVLWLHGHRHGFFHHAAKTVAPFPIVCSGSGTEAERCSYVEYEINGDQLNAHRRRFDLESGQFRDAEEIDLLRAPNISASAILQQG